MTRAAHRLEIARGLLGLAADANVLLHVNSMPPADRRDLQRLVDWVEQYDFEDALG
jgi:hypothetical protein